MSNGLTRGKVAKNILLVLVLFILVLTISPQNVLAEETRRVNASEILENITRGVPVEINNNSIIIGDLDVSVIRDDLDPIKIDGIKKWIVKSPISIEDSTIQGKVNFNPIYFNENVVFKNVTFEDEADFWYASFNKTAEFSKSTFKDKADFKNATFNKYAAFDFVTFDDATFCNALFVEKANFHNSNFNDFAYFFNATFNNSAGFQWATFNDAVIFKHATFNCYATFMDATFNKAYFDFAKFNETANFINTEFNDEANFQNALFNDTAYFILARFKDRAYFTNASFENKVNFSEADIFLTMKIRWSQLEGKLVYDGYFYQSLIRNFETLGQSEDANDAYYKYKVEKRKHINIKSLRGLGRRPLEFLFLDLSCGYGVKPLNPLGWAVFFIGVFAIFYWIIEVEGRWKRLHEHVKDKWKGSAEFLYGLIKGKENKKLGSDSSLKDKLKRFWEFFKDRGKRTLKFLFLSVSIFTTLGKWTNWKPAEGHETWFHFFVIIEVFLGWIIMVLFIISLTMTWIR